MTIHSLFTTLFIQEQTAIQASVNHNWPILFNIVIYYVILYHVLFMAFACFVFFGTVDIFFQYSVVLCTLSGTRYTVHVFNN